MPTPALVHRRVRTSGFTLVEVLMVVAIIGILVGLLVPAVNMARLSIERSAMSLEVQTLANSVEQYRNKYGDYPPDGTNGVIAIRHLRKAFPNIAQTEVDLLEYILADQARSVPFFLGGFSSDPAFPITGIGGPIYLSQSGTQRTSSVFTGTATVAVEYNTDRSNSLYEFKQENLNLKSGLNVTRTTTSPVPQASKVNILPEYRPKGKVSPYVYFDSRTYLVTGNFSAYANTAVSSSDFITPYISTVKATGSTALKMVNDKSFQLLCAGIDDVYGGASGVSYQYPTGQSYTDTSTTGSQTRYVVTAGQTSNQLDNCANFAEGILEDGLEN